MRHYTSIPLGVYWISRAPVEKGAYVLLCPPRTSVFDAALATGWIGAGFCPGGYGFMMQRVVATTGDTVTITDHGVQVNGQLVPRSAPIRGLVRHVSATHTVLTDSEVLLMSDVSATSFDGRYFGPIDRSRITGVLRPVFTW